MRYISTRGQASAPDFAAVLLAGLAEDGGLFMPASWPQFSAGDFRAMRGLPYAELAARVMQPFIGPAIPYETLRRLCHESYAGFGHPAVAPLVQLDTNLWTQELFHGPTLAFKDMAMQLLGRLFDHVLNARGEHVTIVGATSGDTGSAAIEACANRDRVNIVILHPHGRTSEVQRRQMTTVQAPNVSNIAVDGTFDDCQDLVKAMFADAPFRQEMHLSAVNSINWARITAQIPYYVAAALALGGPDRDVTFSVPTGNFGNVLAAWAARRIGLPVARLIVGANRNDILARFLDTNDMSMRPVEPSLSPSMDIQVSSNFERLLFELVDRDSVTTAAAMREFRTTGKMPIKDPAWQNACALFQGFRLDDAQTLDEIRALHARTGYLADPHSIIGIAAARAQVGASEIPIIAMATAHPAKFPDAMRQATGITPALPPRLADLYQRDEHYTVLPNDLAAVQSHTRAFARRNAA
ncbi:MAG: threonine synthase [Acetobacteraceae bacterium]|nr:threonine synthase [Acetobacteraceae bacterium]MSP29135.1 threonine synthase [Acetobacteraceae bacterium]